jgi:hypothetical protein
MKKISAFAFASGVALGLQFSSPAAAGERIASPAAAPAAKESAAIDCSKED